MARRIFIYSIKLGKMAVNIAVKFIAQLIYSATVPTNVSLEEQDSFDFRYQNVPG